MPRERTSKSLAERVDTSYLKRPNRPRKWRVWLALVALLAPLGWLTTAESRGNRAIYQAGPLSTKHQLLAHNCQACHVEHWQPLVQLVGFGEEQLSTPNAACIKCHEGPIHQQNEIAGAFACADCHREHRGHAALAHVDDRFCVRCHADLQTKDGPSQQFVRTIENFSQHPDFALKRPVSGAPAQEPDRQLEQIAQAVGEQWKDKAQIALNHQVHLNPAGIPRQPGDKQLVVMRCEDCHQLDSQRRYMQPIAFDKHCANCHADQLNFSAVELAEPIDTRLPHRNPEIVRGVMRERLTSYIKDRLKDDPHFLGNAEGASSSDPTDPNPSNEKRAFPGQAPSEKLTREAWDWVSQRMQVAESLLLREKSDADQRGTGCAFCHVVKHDDGEVQIVPPRIPDRWLGHSQFRHGSHEFDYLGKTLTCTDCHDHAPQSTTTSDILMPAIENCRKCHGASTGTAGAARSDCVECHAYHGPRDAHSAGHLLEGILQRDATLGSPAAASNEEDR